MASGAVIVRDIGGALQIAGVVAVAYDITSTRRLLEVPSARERLADMMRRLFGSVRRWAVGIVNSIRRSGHDPHATAHGRSISEGAAAFDIVSGVVTRAPEAGMAVGDRLDRHLARLNTLDTSLEQLRNMIEAARRAAASEVSESVHRNEAAIGEVRDLVAALSGGTLRIRWWGGAFIILGVAMTTWPAGIAMIF